MDNPAAQPAQPAKKPSTHQKDHAKYQPRSLRDICPVTRGMPVQFPLESLSKCRGMRILSSENGLRLSIAANRDGGYDFHISCIVGNGTDVVGDGGSWKVALDPDWRIIRAFAEGREFYD